MGRIGQFGQLGVGQTNTPFYNYETQVDPTTGRTSQRQTLAGMKSQIDPFSAAFGNSVNTMNNLGSTIGSQFGAINAMNSQANQQNQNRNLISSILGRLFGGGGGGGGGGLSGGMGGGPIRHNYTSGGNQTMTAWRG